MTLCTRQTRSFVRFLYQKDKKSPAKTGSGQTHTTKSEQQLTGAKECRLVAIGSKESEVVAGCHYHRQHLWMRVVAHTPIRKRSVFKFSLCLSRACRGKKIIFIYEWLKRTVFLPANQLKARVKIQSPPRDAIASLSHAESTEREQR